METVLDGTKTKKRLYQSSFQGDGSITILLVQCVLHWYS